MLPKAEGPGDVARVNERLDELDPEQRVEILPIVTETARAVLTLSRYLDSELSRLYGMSWGAEDLSAELGAVSNRDSNGQFSFTYRMARSQALLTARALHAEAVDTVFTDFRDLDGLRVDSLESYREGFSGRLAIHPEQVEIINRCYSPDQEAVDQAERIVNAFESNPDAGTVGLDGRMLDRPHLAQARRVLAMAEVLNQADRR